MQHPMMNVLDRLEPCHARVMNMVRFVVEDGQFLDFADDLAEVGLAVGGLADGLRAEGLEEVVAQVVVFQGRFGHVAKIDAMDVREKQISGVAEGADVVLNMQRDLKVVAPVCALHARYRAGRDR